MMWGGGWGGMGLGLIFMILAVVAVVVLVVLLIRWFGGSGGAYVTPRSDTALDILKQRYARGEIDKEEFDERRRIIDV